MWIAYITCIKHRQSSFAEFTTDPFFHQYLMESYHRLSQLSHSYQHVSSRRSKFWIASGFCSQPSRYDVRYSYVKRFCRLKTRASAEHAKLPSALCFASPRELSSTQRTRDVTLSEWNYRYYRSRRKRGARPPRESTEGRALYIHGNCQDWSMRCVGRSL